MKKHRVYIFLISLIILVRIAYFYAQPDLCTDHVSQMAMAQNFMSGHGLSFKFLDINNQIYYKTHIQWPPLYTLILALISFLTANSLASSLIIQIAVLFFLVTIWKKIFNLLKNLVSDDAYFYFISLLLISTSILNNINTILVFALLLLSLSIYFTFAYLFHYKSRKINLVFSAFFAASLFWTHYSYFFVAFYPAVVLFIIFYSRKNKTYLYDALKSFTIGLFLTSGVLVYNYLSTSFINYMDNPGIWNAGFFPKQLLLIDPFFLNAFFKSAYLIDYLFSSNQHLLLKLLFQLVSLLIFISIIVLFLKLRRNKNLPVEKSFRLFLPFIVIIVLTISFLLYFTLHYHEIPRPGWTHIGDPRYLSPVYLSVIAIFVLLIFIKNDYINKKFLNFIKVVSIILIYVSLLINIYITIKEWGNYSYKTDTYIVPEKDLQELYDNIKTEFRKGNLPVFVNNDLTVRSSRMSQYAGAAVINVDEVKLIKQFPSNMVFFFILPEEKYYRDMDYQLIKWGNKFTFQKVGKVYSNTSLFKVIN